MGTGFGEVAGHGVLVHADQAAGGPGPAALAEVIEEVKGLGIGQSGLLQDGALAFGEAGLTSAAVDHADAMALATVAPKGEISVALYVLVGAVVILVEDLFDGMYADPS